MPGRSSPGRSSGRTPTSAKHAPPRLRGVLPRARLLARLRDEPAPLTWICGSPGIGKTTLMASHVQGLGAPAFWYRVDAGDADPVQFFGDLVLALGPTGMRRARWPRMPAEAGLDPLPFARTFFRHCAQVLPRHSVLVLDDFHEADAALEPLLRVAVEELAGHVNLFVLSLARPSPVLARPLANGAIHVLGADELQLTRAESDALVAAHLACDDAHKARLFELSGGWVAGLALLIGGWRGTAIDPGLGSVWPGHGAGTFQHIFDYFANQLLARCTEAEQHALMLCAWLPAATVPAVQAACEGGAAAQPVLDRLLRHHLFVSKTPGAEPVYRFHTLLRSFLLARADAALPAGVRNPALARAAARLAADGRTDDAIDTYLLAHDAEAALPLIVARAPPLAAAGRWQRLRAWVDALPAGTVERLPWLAYWIGSAEVFSRPVVARQHLEAAYRGFVAGDDRVGCILAAGACTRSALLGPDWRLLDPWIDALDAALARGPTTAVPDEVLLTGASRLVYVMLARQPLHARLPHWVACTRQRLGADTDTDAHADPDPAARVVAGFSLLFHDSWTGDTTAAEQVVRVIEPLALQLPGAVVARVYWGWAVANHVLLGGDAVQARQRLDDAIALARDHGLAIAAVLRRHRVALLLATGQVDKAAAELDGLALEPLVEPYLELRAWLALLRGDPRGAIGHAHEALRVALQRGRRFYVAIAGLLGATASALAGELDAAAQQLAAARGSAQRMPGAVFAMQADLIESFIALRQGGEHRCDSMLRRALASGRQQRLRNGWGLVPALLVPLFDRALRQGIETGYVCERIRLQQLPPPGPDTEHWPWPVRVRSFGRFEVSVNGSTLKLNGKAQRKPLELLKVLVAGGDRPQPVDRLVALLWPEPAEGRRNALDVTLHRLRRLLGHDDALELSERQLRLNPSWVQVDAWLLPRLLDPLLRAVPPAPPHELERVAERAFALYGGPFLPADADEPWQMPARQQLQGRLLDLVRRLGEAHQARADWAAGERLYQRAIEAEPLAEFCHRERMRCLQAQGRRAEALQAYRQCRALLGDALGVAPDAQTESLHQQLQQG